MRRLVEHGRRIALVFARTEVAWMFESVWPRATALLFLSGQLHFYHPDGMRARGNSGGSSVLVAYGDGDAAVLERSGRLARSSGVGARGGVDQ